jgi:uncharacterized Zn finger protein
MLYDWRRYVPVAVRRHAASRELAGLTKKGHSISPVVVEGRAIARTFWGKAWCDNLERYSDFANRLPRGRTYVRNGSVIHLEIAPGDVQALVSGTDIYTVTVKVSSVGRSRWRAICQDCTGAIDSLVELLQGRFSRGVMERLCREKTGLFPSPAEIDFDCSCPDWASMCKHVAAVLYGVGARLDEHPELLFALRRADERDLITPAGAEVPLAATQRARGKILDDAKLTEIFGIELASIPPPIPVRARRKVHVTSPSAEASHRTRTTSSPGPASFRRQRRPRKPPKG